MGEGVRRLESFRHVDLLVLRWDLQDLRTMRIRQNNVRAMS